MLFTVEISGGVAPYEAQYTVYCGNSVMTNGAIEGETFSYRPEAFGEYRIEVFVTDAICNEDYAECSVPVAVREVESRAHWENTMSNVQLTGNWAEDIVSIARTQLGYHESERNFIIDEKGNKQGFALHWM